MKINWGGGIVIAIALFIGFILFFVIKMSTNKKYDHDLVSASYYKNELAYQEEIDKEKNLLELEKAIEVINKKEGLSIVFPNQFLPNKIKGKMFLYRPSNKKLDVEIPLSITSNVLFLPRESLVDGRWNITIDFEYEGTPYLYKKEIVF